MDGKANRTTQGENGMDGVMFILDRFRREFMAKSLMAKILRDSGQKLPGDDPMFFYKPKPKPKPKPRPY